MAIEINHETNDIVNSTGQIKVNSTAVGGDNTPVPPWFGSRGVFAGGFSDPGLQNVIGYITIASAGNATDFGNLSQARTWSASSGSTTRGVFGGGGDGRNNGSASSNGTANTGGGGGGGGDGDQKNARSGGSGVVVIRYRTS